MVRGIISSGSYLYLLLVHFHAEVALRSRPTTQIHQRRVLHTTKQEGKQVSGTLCEEQRTKSSFVCVCVFLPHPCPWLVGLLVESWGRTVLGRSVCTAPEWPELHHDSPRLQTLSRSHLEHVHTQTVKWPTERYFTRHAVLSHRWSMQCFIWLSVQEMLWIFNNTWRLLFFSAIPNTQLCFCNFKWHYIELALIPGDLL